MEPTPLFRRPRWVLAALLFAAVQGELEAARRRQLVRVMGPGGRSKVLRRADAERLVARGKLRRAPDVETARAELGLAPLIGVTADTDHTSLAGAAGEELPR